MFRTILAIKMPSQIMYAVPALLKDSKKFVDGNGWNEGIDILNAMPRQFLNSLINNSNHLWLPWPNRNPIDFKRVSVSLHLFFSMYTLSNPFPFTSLKGFSLEAIPSLQANKLVY